MFANIEEYKKAVSKFATGVTVVTTSYADNLYGITINSFASLSLDPTLVLFNIGNNSSNIDTFNKASYFNINILEKSQKDIAILFSGKNNLKFLKLNYTLNQFNIPKIKNSLSIIECSKEKIIDCGDHKIFIAKVFKTSFQHNKEPLIYYNSKFNV